MSLVADQLLTWLLLYGCPVLFLGVLIGSVGVPLPVSVLAMAAGGFAAEGDLDLVVALLVVLGAAVLGDCVVYGVASWAGEGAVHSYGARVGLSGARLEAARRRYGARMEPGLFLTRWLVTALAFPTGLLAGISRYPAVRFGAIAVLGEMSWTGIYVGLGYVFGQNWQGVAEIAQDSAGLVAGVAIAIGSLFLLYRLSRARRRPAGVRARVAHWNLPPRIPNRARP